MLRIDPHFDQHFAPNAIALVCQGNACLEPATSLDMCEKQLIQSMSRVI